MGVVSNVGDVPEVGQWQADHVDGQHLPVLGARSPSPRILFPKSGPQGHLGKLGWYTLKKVNICGRICLYFPLQSSMCGSHKEVNPKSISSATKRRERKKGMVCVTETFDFN